MRSASPSGQPSQGLCPQRHERNARDERNAKGDEPRQNAVVVEGLAEHANDTTAAARTLFRPACPKPYRALSSRVGGKGSAHLCARQPGGGAPYSRAAVSSQIVTGPSLTSATCMCAPNTPVGTGLPRSRSSARTNAANAGAATSGAAAALYEGRAPLRVDAKRVNWLTARSSPPTSVIERFITPASSSKMRKVTILRDSQSRSASVSV